MYCSFIIDLRALFLLKKFSVKSNCPIYQWILENIITILNDCTGISALSYMKIWHLEACHYKQVYSSYNLKYSHLEITLWKKKAAQGGRWYGFIEGIFKQKDSVHLVYNGAFRRSKHCIVWSCKMFVMLLPKLNLILNYISRSWIFQWD